MFHRLFLDLVERFARNRGGNVALMFAIAIVPLLIAMGAAIDYALAAKMRTKMEAAADAASLSAIVQQSPGYTAAAAMTSNGNVPAGSAEASNIFNANMQGITGYSNLSLTTTVTKTNSALASTVSFTAQVPTTFMRMFGYPTIAISGSSTSNATLPLYLDFYLMLDVSGSMGLPSTNGEETRLTAINPDNYTLYPNGCVFACHFTTQGACPNAEQKYNTNGYCLGYALSRTAGGSGAPVTSCPTPGASSCIQLRADAVGYAVTQLFQTANATEVLQNQYRIGLYPFIQYLYAYFPLTSSINNSSNSPGTINYAAANLATLLDTGVNGNLGSGGTHFENAFPAMNIQISSVGNGSAPNNTLPFLFLITDGSQNYQTQWNQSWSGSNSATTLDPSLCATLKNRGIRISVLYIPYQLIQNPTNFANSEDFAANANIPNIPASLQSCASPNLFFTASTPSDITASLNAMFAQAVVSAHITR